MPSDNNNKAMFYKLFALFLPYLAYSATFHIFQPEDWGNKAFYHDLSLKIWIPYLIAMPVIHYALSKREKSSEQDYARLCALFGLFIGALLGWFNIISIVDIPLLEYFGFTSNTSTVVILSVMGLGTGYCLGGFYWSVVLNQFWPYSTVYLLCFLFLTYGLTRFT